MKRLMREAAVVGLKAVSVAVDPLFGRLAGPRILIYHQVGTDLGRQMEVPASAFADQLAWMKRTGRIVGLDTALEQRSDPHAVNQFVLTFDDGFADLYDNAFPLMRDQGLPFTLYLTTSPVETGRPLDPEYPAARPLTWDQVNQMAQSGLMTLGAHTHTHPDLRTIASEQIVEELGTSNSLIEQRTGLHPVHFTYPWGRWSKRADAVVRDHYETATVGGTGTAAHIEENYRIVRLPVQRSDSSLFFRARIKRGLRLEEKVRDWRSHRR